MPFRDLAKILDVLLKNKYIEQRRFKTRIFYKGLYDVAKMMKHIVIE